MDWFKIMDGMAEHPGGRQSDGPPFRSSAYSVPSHNWEGPTENRSVGKSTLFRIGGKFVLAAFGIWLFCYVSTLFPYLGRYHYSYFDGVREDYNVGMQHMLLFEGQTAFIEYETKSADGPSGSIYVDIVPLLGPMPSAHLKTLNGEQTGVLEVPITKTGVYSFQSRFNSLAYRENLNYTVTWGAR
jgi:hypothetical protein